ncbi:MAG: hypothetical protein ACAI35_08690 [Candidatus Methylacidiphilales bacterium]|nr:hypothetical protein [Candidatus Methylacidiphilales bacterium]
MDTETKTSAPAATPETSSEKLIYYPIHPRMRIPYLIAGYIFVGLSVLLVILQIVNPEPLDGSSGHNVVIIATIVFASYLIYTANTKTVKVDSKHAGIQFWISLGAACGFITVSLCVAWLLAKIITA